MTKKIKVHLKTPHKKQEAFVTSNARKIIIRAGRRGGKTTGIAIKAVQEFMKGKRVLYASPTIEQVDRFWIEVTMALKELVDAKIVTKNKTYHTLTNVKDERNRIKAKTAWNPDTLRGDFADTLILDEFQLMDEAIWDEVGAPMMLDYDGQAIFIYTPPSLLSSGASKARDPRHAAKRFKEYSESEDEDEIAISFTSHDNPHISQKALSTISRNMSKSAYRREILAEDDEGSDSWLVYRAFDESVCRIPRFPIPDTWPRYVGHDFGGANPAALFFAQDPATGFFYAYHEYLPGGGLSTSQHVVNFKEITNGTNVLRRMGGSHQENEIREGYTAHGWPIQEPTISGVGAQMDRVCGLMELNKLFIFEDLVNYLDEIMNCLWVLDKEGRTTNEVAHKNKYHLCDCARYILSSFTPETVKQKSNKNYGIRHFY